MLSARACRSSSVLAQTPPVFNPVVWAALLCGVGCVEPEPQGELPPVEDLASVQQASVDCTQWTDTGYVDGVPFAITLVTVDGKPAEISTANAYVVMQQAAAAAGVDISVVSGFRTYAEQQYLYNCYVNCNCNNCNLAAKPGYSNHQSGHALDLNTSTGSVLTWLDAHGADYGFSRTVPSEAWHWEWWGGGPGGGPCTDNTPPTPCTVDTTGKTGECMDTSACAALGNHESTPGYCPGPSNIQCCTATTPPPVEAGAEDAQTAADADAEVALDGGGEAGAGGQAGASDASGAGGGAGTTLEGGADTDDAGPVGSGGSGAVWRPGAHGDVSATGPCSLVAGPRAGGWGAVAATSAVGVLMVLRKRRRSRCSMPRQG